ncbi:helix-turn-helix domain-containing protein [Nocardia higoensis]|uniref:Helix-turn-helix domain-containing protein n=1 Tax=Nocardia higoensis TaxID=228599 RepID=A0ABS0D883_9NOCA|nr:helix-turn-helix domain-containing protein [Nocardia higoensis]MBF6353054.1 helix-turn-helix domain-containing protein [Nocardia higoensis]
MRIGILAYEGCFASEVFAVSDFLRIADHVARDNGAPGAEVFRTSVVAASLEPVTAAGGFTIGARRWHHGFDLLVVPGFELSPATDLDVRLGHHSREIDFLSTAARRGIRIASVCVGAFLLGEAGLLNERRCTTSWLFASRLARRYPQSTVCAESLIVTDEQIITTAAFTASLDLATAIVRDHLGADVARATARITLVSENRTSQAPYVVESMVETSTGPFAIAVQQWLVDHLTEPYSLSRLADAFHVSTRTMLRRYAEEAGCAPLTFLQEARIGAAKRFLTDTEVPIGEIPRRVGYQDPSTLRRLFLDRVGMGLGDYRRQFRAR